MNFSDLGAGLAETLKRNQHCRFSEQSLEAIVSRTWNLTASLTNSKQDLHLGAAKSTERSVRLTQALSSH